MAKDRIEQPPKIDKTLEKIDSTQFYQLLLKYPAVDEKGRYLHWNEFKWRVDSKDNPIQAWVATKINRQSLLKELELLDKAGDNFKFCIPASLQSRIYQITRFSTNNFATALSNEFGAHIQSSFFVSSLLMEEAISSAQLEGANTTRRVAKEMLESERAPKNEDERMIVNNFLLMKEAKRRCLEPLSIELILDFHRIATLGTTKNSVMPGEFRKDNNVCIVDGLEQMVVYQPPDFAQLLERMKRLCEFANKEHSKVDGELFIEPVVKAIILHFMIGYEHPFADGNGRTARALFYWFLLKNGYKLFEYIPISKLLKSAPLQYGAAYLRTETDDNDLTYFFYYQIDIILRAIKEFTDYLHRRAQEYYELFDILKNLPINERLNFVQREILKKAVKHPGRIFTVKEIKNDFDVTDNTARAYLNYLVELKLLIRSKEGKTMQYISPANLRERLNIEKKTKPRKK